MAQVERAFSGRYREVNRETQQWYTYNHPVPEPRPGAVSGANNILGHKISTSTKKCVTVCNKTFIVFDVKLTFSLYFFHLFLTAALLNS